MNLKKLFLDYCEIKEYEINQNQLNIIKFLTPPRLRSDPINSAISF